VGSYPLKGVSEVLEVDIGGEMAKKIWSEMS